MLQVRGSRWLAFMFAATSVLMAAGVQAADGTCTVRSGDGTGVLLELYTSEGCSSCPPADQWFAAQAARAKPEALSLLAFHVDYWDQLGWKDPFAQSAFSRRQSDRVQAQGSRTVYTPQVMASSHTGLRWSDNTHAQATIAELQRQPARASITLTTHRSGAGWHVSVSASPAAKGAVGQPALYLALAQDGLHSAPTRGENAGARLAHARVARGLWGPWPLTGSGVARELQVDPAKSASSLADSPGNAGTSAYTLVAFVQDRATGEGWQALSLPLADCR